MLSAGAALAAARVFAFLCAFHDERLPMKKVKAVTFVISAIVAAAACYPVAAADLYTVPTLSGFAPGSADLVPLEPTPVVQGVMVEQFLDATNDPNEYCLSMSGPSGRCIQVRMEGAHLIGKETDSEVVLNGSLGWLVAHEDDGSAITVVFEDPGDGTFHLVLTNTLGDAEAYVSVGADGPEGPEGATGPRGQQGPSGVSNYVVVTGTSALDSADEKDAGAYCPRGTMPFGGGAYVAPYYAPVAIRYSFPNGSSWGGRAFETKPFEGLWQIEVYAVCATVEQ
jgi:hypothetical protein